MEVDWVPRAENNQADFVSRLIDTDDWMFSKQFFQEQIMGPN